MDADKVLKIISRAWGRNQEGYCFFPWIDREEQARAGIRRAGFYEGPAFSWPRDRGKILAHLEAHKDHDLYWCPSLFEYDTRRSDLASDEHALWADLDTTDPRDINDYPPTIAWETSPGRYQGLWIISQGDIQGASWPGNENQRLTYYIGADPSGWDTTQLLRIPGWANHKLEYREKYGSPPEGRLLWTNGRTYLPDEFEDLPEVQGALATGDITEALAEEVEAIDPHKVLARVKLKLTQRVRDLISSRVAEGDRSSILWEIERSLADAGCSITEIVAVVRNSVWNKFEGRADELKRLILEATKAFGQKSEAPTHEEILKEEASALELRDIISYVFTVKPPDWLVKDILTEGGVGFIAGEPKSYKSWLGLDMAISVASGARFLNYFDVRKSGPVLYIQEEDGPAILKDRITKVLKSKERYYYLDIEMEDNGPSIYMEPAMQVQPDLPIKGTINGGIVLSEGPWQEWLDDTLAKQCPLADGSTQAYRLLLIDTLMMVAGAVDDHRSQDMTTKLFKPLKLLARKHGVAILVVHHMNKSGADGKRPGQRMLGSVANHAWSEDSMYLQLDNRGSVNLHTESKWAQGATYRIAGVGAGKRWSPEVMLPKQDQLLVANGSSNGRTSLQINGGDIITAITELGGRATNPTLQEHLGLGRGAIDRRLKAAASKLVKRGHYYCLKGTR